MKTAPRIDLRGLLGEGSLEHGDARIGRRSRGLVVTRQEQKQRREGSEVHGAAPQGRSGTG